MIHKSDKVNKKQKSNTSKFEELCAFKEAYAMPGIDGCRRVIELYDQGLRDFGAGLDERVMVHRAIVFLADKLDALAQQKGGV